MKQRVLLGVAVGVLTVLSATGFLGTERATAPIIDYSIVSATVTHGHKDLRAPVAECLIGSAQSCALPGSNRAANRFGTALGITIDELAAALGIPAERTTALSVSCTAPRSRSDERYDLYSIGTLYRYKIQKSVVFGPIRRLLATSGWKTTYKASGNLIYCKVGQRASSSVIAVTKSSTSCSVVSYAHIQRTSPPARSQS
jgi:hypothetical protein